MWMVEKCLNFHTVQYWGSHKKENYRLPNLSLCPIMLEYWSKQHLSIVRSSSIENSIKNQKSTWKGYIFETMHFWPLSQNVFGTLYILPLMQDNWFQLCTTVPTLKLMMESPMMISRKNNYCKYCCVWFLVPFLLWCQRKIKSDSMS